MARPRFDPTDEQRNLVKVLAAFGCPQDYIAGQVIDPRTKESVSETTLKNKFRAELAQGEPRLIAEAGTWVTTHMRGRKAIYENGKLVAKEIEPELKAAIFILETRGKDYGWAKRSEFTGADGTPLAGPWDLSQLDENEIRQLKALAQKALPPPAS